MKKRVFNVLVKLSIIRKNIHITVGATRVNEVIYHSLNSSSDSFNGDLQFLWG